MQKIFLFFVCLILLVPCYAEVIYVDDDGPADFNNIQDAINDCNDGDTIVVQEGIYIGQLDLLSKNFILIGSDPNDVNVVDNTIIRISETYGLTNLGSNSVISGLSFSDCISTYLIHGVGAGIGATISNCKFYNNSTPESLGFVIYRFGGIVERCHFANNISEVLYLCDNSMVRGIIATGNKDSVVQACDSITIEGSLFVGNKSITPVISGKTGIIQNCIFVGNQGTPFGTGWNGFIKHCIIHLNTKDMESSTIPMYCCIDGYDYGVGNISTDPLFVDPGHWYYDPNVGDMVFAIGDYHLKSQAGRWDSNAQSWTYDEVTSPCIDAGDPYLPVGNEPYPNGGRVNIGLYGGTFESSKSIVPQYNPADFNRDGIVNFFDLAKFVDNWLWQGL